MASIIEMYEKSAPKTSNANLKGKDKTNIEPLNLGLDFILIPQFGIIGGAYATTCAYFVKLLVLWFHARKKLKKIGVNLLV